MGGRALAGLLVALALLGAGVLLAFAGGEGGPRVPYPAQLRTDSGAIVDDNGNEVLLRGFNLLPVYGAEGGTPAADHYVRIRDKGFNVVRFPVYWSDMEPSKGEFNEVALETLDEAIANARKAGLYVVLDPVHLFDGTRFVPAWAHPDLDETERWDAEKTSAALRETVQENAVPYLRMMAARYRDNRAVAAYDLVNEPPSVPVDQNAILRMYDSLIRSVREVDGGKIVMIEPSFGNSSMVGADLGLLSDKRNLVFSMHDYYAGGAGDGYTPSGEADFRYDDATGIAAGGGNTTYESDSFAELEAHLRVNLTLMEAEDIPVWIGEFGVNPDGPSADRWIEDKVALFKQYGLGYAWWLYGVRGEGGSNNEFPTLEDNNRDFRPFVDRLL
ncbi:MAG TPA: cellulase family glycosylhydrolase [Thermoleophilaceae bacterium]|nr:cellulase family glycosylhydrolase [Thermoleophilaceae bacterium]